MINNMANVNKLYVLMYLAIAVSVFKYLQLNMETSLEWRIAADPRITMGKKVTDNREVVQVSLKTV